jgi:hypothetical protein
MDYRYIAIYPRARMLELEPWQGAVCIESKETQRVEGRRDKKSMRAPESAHARQKERKEGRKVVKRLQGREEKRRWNGDGNENRIECMRALGEERRVRMPKKERKVLAMATGTARARE